MSDLKTAPFDVADMLTDNEVIAEFLNQSNNPDDFDEYLSAFSASIRAVGLEEVCNQTGVPPSEILEAFQKGGDPSLHLTLKVAKAMGLRMSVRPIEKAEGK